MHSALCLEDIVSNFASVGNKTLLVFILFQNDPFDIVDNIVR